MILIFSFPSVNMSFYSSYIVICNATSSAGRVRVSVIFSAVRRLRMRRPRKFSYSNFDVVNISRRDEL